MRTYWIERRGVADARGPGQMEDFYQRSCLALQAVGHSLETMLGPNKVLKCYISHDDNSGILGDAMQVLDIFLTCYVGRPFPHLKSDRHGDAPPGNTYDSPLALRLLYRACREQRSKVGCGVTTLVCFSAYLAPEVLDLLHQGLPLPYIFGIFRYLLHMCKEHFKSLKIDRISTLQPTSKTSNTRGVKTGESHQSDHVIREREGARGRPMAVLGSRSSGEKRPRVISTYSRYFRGRGENEIKKATIENNDSYQSDLLISKKLVHGKERAMALVTEVRRKRLENVQDHKDTSQEKIRVPLQYCMVGKPEGVSRVVEGVVTQLHSTMVDTGQCLSAKQLTLVLLQGDCTPDYKHLGLLKKPGHVMSHDLAQLYAANQTSVWLDSITAIIKKFEIGVIVVGGAVLPLLWERCIGAGVLVLKDVAAKTREAISDLSGARPISYFTQCSKDVLGVGLCIEVLESGWAIPRVAFAEATPMATPTRYPVKTHCCRLYKDPTSVSSGQHCHPKIVTVLLCGLSEYHVDNLQHQFINCYHRFHQATAPTTSSSYSQPRLSLLPGGGRTEASCIALLQKHLQETKDFTNSWQHFPSYFSQSWVTSRPAQDITAHWKALVYRAFTNALGKYVTRVLMNARPGLGQYEAMCEVEEMVTGGSVGVGEVLDVTLCKEEAWSRVVDLLETIFFSRKLDCSYK